jgi:hypothetical protein
MQYVFYAADGQTVGSTNADESSDVWVTPIPETIAEATVDSLCARVVRDGVFTLRNKATDESARRDGLRCFSSLNVFERRRIRDSIIARNERGEGSTVGHYLRVTEQVTTAGECGDSDENPFYRPP